MLQMARALRFYLKRSRLADASKQLEEGTGELG